MAENIPCRRLIEIDVPDEFNRIPDLAYNLWWSWTPRARRLFSFMEPERWIRYRNPIEILLEMDNPHWKPLLKNDEFHSIYNRVMEDFDDYMDPGNNERLDEFGGGNIAYFSTEFGLHDAIPIYSGGLGVLSGDHLKSASDRNLPLVGVGLYYRNGYFRQYLDQDGTQHHMFPQLDFSRMPVERVLNSNGQPLTVNCPLKQWQVKLNVWKFQVGRISLILLDSNNESNPPELQPITSQLYVRDREMRLCQEIILGVGGSRALREIGIEPAVWHLNEGHSVFLITDRLRNFQEQGMSFEEARANIQEDTLFTTHTPVPAGHEIYDRNLVEEYFDHVFDDLGYDFESFYSLGINEVQDSNAFNLTALSMRFSGRNNAVSKLHSDISNNMWGHLLDEEDGTVFPITNGVHSPTWLGYDIRDLLNVPETCWDEEQCQHLVERLEAVSDEELWGAHERQKDRLIRIARDRIREQKARHGEEPDELSKVKNMIDSDDLLIGFARRFATYKRADMIFRDFDRIKQIMLDADRPVRVMFAGKAHPADNQGKELIKRIYELMNHSELSDHITFIENYNMYIASLMVQGVDVWLNTPRRPNEASGTSGMKAALNGVLNFSIVDGWWAEGYNGDNGWNIGHGNEFEDKQRQDHEDAQDFYRTLEEEVVPAFYDRDDNDLPIRWIEMMRSSISSVVPRFGTNRMVRDYEEKAYKPLANKSAEPTAEEPAETV